MKLAVPNKKGSVPFRLDGDLGMDLVAIYHQRKFNLRRNNYEFPARRMLVLFKGLRHVRMAALVL